LNLHNLFDERGVKSINSCQRTIHPDGRTDLGAGSGENQRRHPPRKPASNIQIPNTTA